MSQRGSTAWRLMVSNAAAGRIPGDAFLYDIGDVHAPRRMSSSRLIRIEGCDTMKVQRTPLMAVEEADAAQ